ncbi:hypothetical protein CHGG_06900 [Chaetomium globosum CBS 148.51]|uniref:HAT C-terminal dimerisation domain-containing protein n=1 Tax=Chaetomium globosum (strain ATCC 6205 / CBS 148.51 / DSM 1962 / NBRC 6347 / NRRL 1970) TaxID=306901 RepID=Q2GYQ4_CHAGB|nr:uncharacterized protein CHGG_06900 [Chaetomium globosum CBS 148.51]EAQ85647.1 hypothetical protein CHGG_06900 [Chaetomium globosum CBS 148.51]
MATEASAAVAAVPTRTEEDLAFLFKRFPGYLFTERKGPAWSWLSDPTGKRPPPSAVKPQRESSNSRSIATFFNLNANNAEDQRMANHLISAFDRAEFQRRIKANLSEKTVHALAVREVERHKDAVVKTLQESPGLVHLVFDGWTSRNRLSLYGVSAVFRDEEGTPHKIVLGLPEMSDRHTGENIAEAILDVIRNYGIEKKIGYFTVDNATNNDAALKIIECDAFEREVSTSLLTTQHEHEQWRRKGPIGQTSGRKKLISAQEQRIREASEGEKIKKHTPVGVVTDNATRWLSQYFMMERALQLQPFYETFLFEAKLHVDSQATVNLVRRSAAPANEPISLVQGASWDLLDGYEFLLESLERAKARVEDLVDGEHVAINVNNAWMKLDKYYEKIGQSPLIYAATALHPRHRWGRFEAWREHHADWIEPAKLQVRELWRQQYRDLPVEQKEASEPPTKIPRLSSNRFAIFRTQERTPTNSAPTSPSPFPSPALVELDEFERWQLDNSDFDRYEEDPRAYWHKRRNTYPRLARMALDLHTVLPMSAEVERLFSVTGHMVTPLRNRLQANTISLCQILRSCGRVRVLVLSRNQERVEAALWGYNFSRYDITADDTSPDIARTTQEVLAVVRRYPNGAAIARDVEKQIKDGANGMYLWARLALTEAIKQLGAAPAGSQQAARGKQLTHGIFPLFDQYLKQFSESSAKQADEDKHFTNIVIFWLTYQAEPMTERELQIACALVNEAAEDVRDATWFEVDVGDAGIQAFLSRHRNMGRAVLDRCAPLARIGPDKRIGAVHRSLQEYLRSPRPPPLHTHHASYHTHPPHANRNISLLCADYLLQPALANPGTAYADNADDRDAWLDKVDDRVLAHAFARYAALYWIYHARAAGPPFDADLAEWREPRHRRLLDVGGYGGDGGGNGHASVVRWRCCGCRRRGKVEEAFPRARGWISGVTFRMRAGGWEGGGRRIWRGRRAPGDDDAAGSELVTCTAAHAEELALARELEVGITGLMRWMGQLKTDVAASMERSERIIKDLQRLQTMVSEGGIDPRVANGMMTELEQKVEVARRETDSARADAERARVDADRARAEADNRDREYQQLLEKNQVMEKGMALLRDAVRRSVGVLAEQKTSRSSWIPFRR